MSGQWFLPLFAHLYTPHREVPKVDARKTRERLLHPQRDKKRTKRKGETK